MKAAARIDRHSDDLQFLYRICGFQSLDKALDCVSEHYPPHLLAPKTEFALRELLDQPPT